VKVRREYGAEQRFAEKLFQTIMATVTASLHVTSTCSTGSQNNETSNVNRLKMSFAKHVRTMNRHFLKLFNRADYWDKRTCETVKIINNCLDWPGEKELSKTELERQLSKTKTCQF